MEQRGVPFKGVSKRPLHFIWIADCSSSMRGEKIASLNTAIRDVIPAIRKVAEDNPNAEIFMRAVKFHSRAEWHIEEPTPVEDFQWIDLKAEGLTAMGEALRLVADALSVEKLGTRGFPPVLVLISDGQPTDDFEGGLQELLNTPWGKKSVRLAIAIGEDADQEVLKKFLSHPEYPVFTAHNAEQLYAYIRFASTAVLKSVSTPPSKAKDGEGVETNVYIPKPPEDYSSIGQEDVW